MSTPQGTIYLLNNVPLTASYEHTIDFKNRDEQYSYFMKFLKRDLSNYTYIRKEREYITAELGVAELDDINYLLFKSSAADRLYYAFVTDKIYVNEYTTQIFFSIDVLQTFQFDYKWQPSYIKQSHVDRWTAGHLPIYSKTEEGLNYGSEYVVESAYRLEQSKNIKWVLVTLKNANELVNEGTTLNRATFKGFPTSFAHILLPIYSNYIESGFYVENTDSDGKAIGYIDGYEHFSALLLESALGNFIVSMALLPYNPLIESETYNGITNIRFRAGSYSTVTFTNKKERKFLVIRELPFELQEGNRLLAVTDWDTGLDSSLPTAEQWEEIKAKPRTTKRDKRFESKLLCSPYRYNILTDWRNAPAIFKNEYLTTDKLNVMFSYAFSTTTPFRYWIKDYRRDLEGRYTSVNAPLSMDLPIISDAYYTYMLENKNTIQANLTNATINAGASTLQGAISGAAVGGVWGAVGGAATGVANGVLNISAQIRSENAKQADIKARPDTIINSTDSSFNVHDKTTDLTFYRMRICCENEEIIANIFNMSGYLVNRVELPNTRSRTRFNYIQTVGANIIGSFNQTYLERIKGIYDRGVTIWHYSEKDFNFLDYSYENIEVNLV